MCGKFLSSVELNVTPRNSLLWEVGARNSGARVFWKAGNHAYLAKFNFYCIFALCSMIRVFL